MALLYCYFTYAHHTHIHVCANIHAHTLPHFSDVRAFHTSAALVRTSCLYHLETSARVFLEFRFSCFIWKTFHTILPYLVAWFDGTLWCVDLQERIDLFDW